MHSNYPHSVKRLASTTLKRLSSNSPAPPPATRARMDTGVQLEVTPYDFFARNNDEINAKITAKLDSELNVDDLTNRPIFNTILGGIIEVAADYKRSPIDKSYLNPAVRKLLFEKYHQLPSLISDAWKNKDFKRIRTLQILQKPKSINVGDNQNFIVATESSWVRDFKGPAATALWHHITHYYKMKNWYANYVAIVQSSGTGKSRTMDELSKTILTIPLCLRSGGSTGYPYADDEVQQFLTSAWDEKQVHLRPLAFLIALFEHTRMVLESLSQERDAKYSDVTASFRQYMNTSQRKPFYCDVVNQAKGHAYNMGNMPSSAVDSLVWNNSMIKAAFKSLQDVITPLRKQENLSSDDEPILLIAWDEAHTLSENDEVCPSWSHFVALRHVLHQLVEYPIFSMFASTTSKVAHFSPDARKYNLIPPFCDFGLDVLVMDSENKVSLDAGRSLDEFITDEYMCHLGRPLFGSHYDYGDGKVRDNLLGFATMKLVKATLTSNLKLSPIQQIACLSFRLPIQFNSTVYASRKHDEDLVKSHMRICLEVDEFREFMHTLSASEPFLSEAAYNAINWNSLAEGRRLAVETFHKLTTDFAIHTGDRGEFLALLLCTLARDATVGMRNRWGAPRSRSFGLAEFLCDNLICNKLASEESQRDLKCLRSDFPNTRLHFNHFIKAREESVITQENILLLMARGAAFLCANCMPGVDFILPFLKDGVEMATGNSGFILAQVKNEKRYGASVDKRLFEYMDPYDLDILKNSVAPPPIIRIVFALASARPSVHVTRHEPSDEYENIIYDIWIAGITSDVLGPIDRKLEGTWKNILQTSCDWRRVFDALSEDAEKIRRSTDVASAGDDPHWIQWSQWTQEEDVD